MHSMRQYGNYRQLNEFDRGRIVGIMVLEIALTEINPPPCTAIIHELGRVKIAFDLWQ